MVQIKRAYVPAAKKDGFRVLVDRLWPRGITKSELPIDSWPKEITPSSELRKRFGHKPENWAAFQRDYKKELKSPAAKETLKELARISKKKMVTLIYAAKNEEINHALVLKRTIDNISSQ